jgi:hypothetical protein
MSENNVIAYGYSVTITYAFLSRVGSFVPPPPTLLSGVAPVR